MKTMFKRVCGPVAAVGALALGGMSAANAAYDTTAITASLTDIATVGLAVFGVFVALHTIKWIRRTL